MRVLRSLVPALLLVACVDNPAEVSKNSMNDSLPDPAVEPLPEAAQMPQEIQADVQLVPLTGTDLKFGGVYKFTIGELHYYMRFFERGSAAFVGGTEKYPGQLASLLTIDVQSGWNQVHNCPVVQRNDSLFIRSVGMKGVITYAGDVRANGDSLRLLRHSEINGMNQIMRYGFIPDSELVPKP